MVQAAKILKPKNKTKILASDVTGTGDISGLQFNNLVIGKVYAVSGCIATNVNANINTLQWWSAAAGTDTQYGTWRDSDFNNITKNLAVNIKFTAVSSTVYVYCSVIVGSIFGNNTKDKTFLTLTEKPNTTITTDFT